MNVACVLLAAGSSERMGENKLLFSFGGQTPLALCAEAFFSAERELYKMAVAVGPATRAQGESLRARYGERVVIVEGGATRAQSVYNALKELQGAQIVSIHDAARCLVSPMVIANSIKSAAACGSGVAGIPARDTVRLAGAGVIDRSRVTLAQTPQSFRYDRIMEAYERAVTEGFEATDDLALYERMGYTGVFTEGSILNQKLTYPSDMPMFEAALGALIRVGYGEDTHRLMENRALVLGGVEIPCKLGLMGHSDADALTHAVIDALLGAAALGDIGRHFPDTDESYKGISSLILLEHTAALLSRAGYRVANIDATVVAQEPRLAPYIGEMRTRIARALGVDTSLVSVKATTPEHLGPEGRLEGITARCICSIKTQPQRN
ncbi:MAG: 2-C-methyl-D-erythritol 2,4-cyclodiphosphate synthase [Clostridiaceae bacterium]|nr:2-C-methyl-D-erythritol 2,4-cyclodiphosphate synthase [Eubacteriales bacterium]